MQYLCTYLTARSRPQEACREIEKSYNLCLCVMLYNFLCAAPPTLYMEGATCITYGFPLPHIFWFNGSTDNVISNSSSVVILENMLGMFTVRSSILVTGSFPGNEGVLYHCGAMNSEGNISLLEDVASCPDGK